ncbi:DUF4405 domain-containing protein [Rhizobium ecuadorense]|uniref:DUF4405 domain-containing protein n=1 Tax=Rhizobium ecuadorense TaxID=1671795 RepID=UPI000AF0B4C3|nr:DUF4405 domain-containing protein [Rhizobium ecuadorense]
MKNSLVTRLLLPGFMAVLLLLSLAYWWLDNLPHELFGTALFTLLAWHLAVNRLWFKNLFRGRYDGRRVVTALLHLLLGANMLVLVITSAIISKSVFAPLPIPDSIYLRDIHWFSAYWVMIVVGVHLGLHWTRVLAMVRSSMGAMQNDRVGSWPLHIAAIVATAFGVWSVMVLGVLAKLTFTYSLDFWDFTASVTPFFGHWAGVVALPAIVTHYGMAWWRRATSAASRQRRKKAEGCAIEDATGA